MGVALSGDKTISREGRWAAVWATSRSGHCRHGHVPAQVESYPTARWRTRVVSRVTVQSRMPGTPPPNVHGRRVTRPAATGVGPTCWLAVGCVDRRPDVESLNLRRPSADSIPWLGPTNWLNQRQRPQHLSRAVGVRFATDAPGRAWDKIWVREGSRVRHHQPYAEFLNVRW